MKPKYILTSFASLGLILGTSTTHAAEANFNLDSQAPASHTLLAKMNHGHSTQPSGEFQQLNQPLWLKALVTTGGLGLIGLELWWFVFSKSKSPSTKN